MTLIADQPRRGETVVHCGHVDRAVHWFKYDAQLRFARPDGTCGEATWLTICDACFVAHGAAAPVRGDGVWTGTTAVIERSAN